MLLPARFPQTSADIRNGIDTFLATIGGKTGIPLEETLFFGQKLFQVLSSCDERRIEQYERIDWWRFIDAAKRSTAYQQIYGHAFTRSLVAAKANRASAKTVGDIFVQMLLAILQPGETTDRLLNGPTNEVWIDPWVDYLTERGLVYHYDSNVRSLNYQAGRITSATITQGTRVFDAVGDEFLLAVPVERAAELVTPDLLRGDPSLAHLEELSQYVEWMNGIQFFLGEDVPIAPGHTIYLDSPWALTSVSQKQFWPAVDLSTRGDGTVRGIISVDISDFFAEGMNGKKAVDCTREEIAIEVWEQLKRSLNATDGEVLKDADLRYWFLDPDIVDEPGSPLRRTNTEPLLVNYVDTWRLRPEATTHIPNLFIASDYVRTYTDLATMEAANEAARRAVNGILSASDTSADRCGIWKPTVPDIFTPLQAYDRIRLRAGQPWDNTVVTLGSTALGVLAGLREQTSPRSERHEELSEPVEELRRNLDGVLPVAVGPAEQNPPRATYLRRSGLRIVRETPSSRSAELVLKAAPWRPDSMGADRASEPDVTERLRYYRDLVGPVIQQCLPAGEPRRYLYDPIRSYLDRAGKGLRPALCIATCAAFGGNTDKALISGAALEVLHNAFLIHDDIEDGSEFRRDQPTMQHTYGLALAVNTGDALQALGVRMLRGNFPTLGPQMAFRVLEEFDHLLIESLEGQALELGWVRDNRCNVTEDDYLRMILKKTCWYSFIHPCRIGALLAGMDASGVDRFNRFGYFLGAAFQIQDDVLNLVGDAGIYGKEIGGDLWEGKRTLILSHLFRFAGRYERQALEQVFAKSRDRRSPRDVRWLYSAIRRYGSIEHAQCVARELTAAALREFEQAYAGAIEGRDKVFLRDIVHFMIERRQ